MKTDDSVKRLQIHRVDRLLKVEKPPALIRGVLGSRAIHIWSGMPYAGKTFLALEAMRAVAEGEPFLGHFPVPRPGNVLYLGNDSPDWDVAAQFEKLVGLPAPENVDQAIAETSFGSYGFVFDPSFNLSTAQDAQTLVEAANRFGSTRDHDLETGDHVRLRGTSLIVIDTLRSVHGYEENDNTEMQHLVNLLRYVSTYTGAAVLALHHFNKSHPGERDRVTLERLRGAVAIAGGVDSVLALVPKDSTVAVRVLKHRVAPEQKDFMYNFIDKGPGDVVLSLASDVGIVNPGVLALVERALADAATWVSTSALVAAIQGDASLNKPGRKAADAVSHALRQMEKAGTVVRMHGAARLATKGVE